MAKHTPGRWDFACDSYGTVRHSRKACVFAIVQTPNGDRLVNIAQKITNWDNARLIAAAPDLLAALTELVELEFGEGVDGQPLTHRLDTAGYYALEQRIRAAIARATV